MCHQSVGLIQGAMERVGISTVSVSVCEEITSKVRPPRVLYVPFPFGFPLGRPGDARLIMRIVRASLELLKAPGPPPVEAHLEGGSSTEPV